MYGYIVVKHHFFGNCILCHLAKLMVIIRPGKKLIAADQGLLVRRFLTHQGQDVGDGLLVQEHLQLLPPSDLRLRRVQEMGQG